MAFSGTGTLVASIVSKMTSSAAMVKAGGAVSGTILAGSKAMTVAAVPPALSAVGFTASGIAASSLAAKMMSLSAIANGGGVPAGGLVAILQSAGAAGLSMPSTVIVGSAGSAVVASVMNICESFYPFLMGSEVADMETEVADISTEEALPNLSNTEKD
uniref:Interferon, alpha-inducible protein 27 n=1 Tax=Mus spicilegus TaxID=10103 RepID=A0A8C6IHZ3_MUSSI